MGGVRNSKVTSFTVFRSAAEEAEMKRGEQEWDNEGGHMSSTSGRVRHVPDAKLPYVVVLNHEGSGTSNQAFATMQEAEAFIKRNTPKPRHTLVSAYGTGAVEHSS